MLRHEVLQLMEKLKLRGMHSVYDEVLSNGRKKRSTPDKMILELLQAEAAERRMRSIRYRMGQARFPVLKDLDQFNFSESCVDEAQIRSLYQGDFLEDHTPTSSLSGAQGPGKLTWPLPSQPRLSETLPRENSITLWI